MVSVIRIHGNWGIDRVNKLKSHTPPLRKVVDMAGQLSGV